MMTFCVRLSCFVACLGVFSWSWSSLCIAWLLCPFLITSARCSTSFYPQRISPRLAWLWAPWSPSGYYFDSRQTTSWSAWLSLPRVLPSNFSLGRNGDRQRCSRWASISWTYPFLTSMAISNCLWPSEPGLCYWPRASFISTWISSFFLFYYII